MEKLISKKFGIAGIATVGLINAGEFVLATAVTLAYVVAEFLLDWHNA